jgi:hypothetical protein
MNKYYKNNLNRILYTNQYILMIINKIIETRLNIDDINSIYCNNYNKMLMEELEKKYVNRCFRSIYVLKILRIIRHSTLNCKNKELDGGIYIDVLCEVSGLIYEKNEVIHNCEIIQINDNNIIHAKAKNVSLQIKNNKRLNIFKEGQFIPVIVMMKRYNLFINEISVSAIPLQPIEKKILFYEIDNKTDLDDLCISELNEVKQLEENILNFKKENKKIYEFFVDLLYPFKNIIKYNKFIYTKEINNENLKNLENVIIFRPEVLLDDNKIYICNKEDIHKIEIDGVQVKLSNNDSKANIIIEYKKNLLQLLSFFENYNTLAKIKEHKIIWQMYNMFKN